MKKNKILARLEAAGVVAVIRENNTESALKAAQAVVEGGIHGLEVTFSVPNADQVIAKLKEIYQAEQAVVVGAGTVLDAVTARLAIMAGAEFVVSPSFDQATAELCNIYQVPYLPGCMTITEMQRAMMSGAEVVKLFPANNFDPQFIKSVQAPLPQINLMPTGGINLANLSDWKQAGAVMVGVGGNLFKGVADQEYEKVTETAREYMVKWREE
ncbi:MAG: bifunctional 2-keto-4-hydroxyglutarate aldolase/2-keto-3-deoxy-6-phosphogluconate aldolase [Enterococcus sp.]